MGTRLSSNCVIYIIYMAGGSGDLISSLEIYSGHLFFTIRIFRG